MYMLKFKIDVYRRQNLEIRLCKTQFHFDIWLRSLIVLKLILFLHMCLTARISIFRSSIVEYSAISLTLLTNLK